MAAHPGIRVETCGVCYDHFEWIPLLEGQEAPDHKGKSRATYPSTNTTTNISTNSSTINITNPASRHVNFGDDDYHPALDDSVREYHPYVDNDDGNAEDEDDHDLNLAIKMSCMAFEQETQEALDLPLCNFNTRTTTTPSNNNQGSSRNMRASPKQKNKDNEDDDDDGYETVYDAEAYSEIIKGLDQASFEAALTLAQGAMGRAYYGNLVAAFYESTLEEELKEFGMQPDRLDMLENEEEETKIGSSPVVTRGNSTARADGVGGAETSANARARAGTSAEARAATMTFGSSPQYYPFLSSSSPSSSSSSSLASTSTSASAASVRSSGTRTSPPSYSSLPPRGSNLSSISSPPYSASFPLRHRTAPVAAAAAAAPAIRWDERGKGLHRDNPRLAQGTSMSADTSFSSLTPSMSFASSVSSSSASSLSLSSSSPTTPAIDLDAAMTLGSSMPCDPEHLFCATCLDRHIDAKLSEGVFPVVCPHFGCKEVIPASVVESLLGAKASRWHALGMEKAVKRQVFCPNKDCNKMIDGENDGDDEDRDWQVDAICPYCEHSFCALCLKDAHEGKTCEQVKKESDPDNLFEVLATRNEWKRCPGCGHMVEKVDGCHHMTCRCGREFCYACQHGRWPCMHSHPEE